MAGLAKLVNPEVMSSPAEFPPKSRIQGSRERSQDPRALPIGPRVPPDKVSSELVQRFIPAILLDGGQGKSLEGVIEVVIRRRRGVGGFPMTETVIVLRALGGHNII